MPSTAGRIYKTNAQIGFGSPTITFTTGVCAGLTYITEGNPTTRPVTLAERQDGEAPYRRDIHCFNFGAAMSQGLISGDVPGMQLGATRLAARISEVLFVGSIEQITAALQAAEEPELAGTAWHDVETIKRIVSTRIGP